MFQYGVYKFIQFFIQHLPLGFSYRLAEILADIQYCISSKDREAVKSNLESILSAPKDINKKTREVFRNFSRYLVEFFWMGPKVDKRYIKKNIRIEGLENLDRALEQEKGVVMITSHIGNWELGAVAVSLLNYPIMAVALTHKHPRITDLFNSQREKKGLKVIPPTKAVKRGLEQLNKKKIFALVADRDFGRKGVVMPFLSRKHTLPKGPAIFSLRTGAPIVLATMIRQENNEFALHIDEPVFPEKVTDRPELEDVKGLIGQYSCKIEKWIKNHPTQWLMFRKYGYEDSGYNSSLQ